MASWTHYIDFMKSRGNIDGLMIISAEDGATWGCSPESFYLREYPAMIPQEDGSEKEEKVNEAKCVLEFCVKGSTPAHGLRINGGKKQQVLRNYKDEETGLTVIFGKIAQGGSCLVHAGKCILIATFNEGSGHTSAACNETLILMGRYLFKSTWPAGTEGGPGAKTAAAIVDGSSTWQPYIDTLLMSKGNISQCLICSKTDGQVWAYTPDFALKVYQAEIPQDDGSDRMETVDEGKNLVQLMSGIKPAQGLRIAEVKYQILRTFEEENSGCYTVYGKRTKGGLCAVATGKAIVLGLFDEAKGHGSAACNTVMSDAAKHLKNKGL